MSGIDILALLAREELANLEAEERRKKRMQPRAVPEPASVPVPVPESILESEPETIRFCRSRRTEHRKTHVVADDDDDEEKDNPVSPSGHDDHHRLPGTRTESKPKKVSSLKFALDIIIRKKKEEEEIGSKNNKEKTEVNIINGPDSPAKKRKPRNDNIVSNISKTTKQQEAADNGPSPNPNPDLNPGLPEKFREKIRERARGREVWSELLVIQKTLTSTDLQDHHNRFSMPFKQMTKERFLRVEDVKFLERRDADGRCNVINIGIIEAEGKVESVNLTRWVMKKPNGEPSISYVLNGEGWKRVKIGNKLQVGDVVQLWAVPIGGDPCFVFVKLD